MDRWREDLARLIDTVREEDRAEADAENAKRERANPLLHVMRWGCFELCKVGGAEKCQLLTIADFDAKPGRKCPKCRAILVGWERAHPPKPKPKPVHIRRDAGTLAALCCDVEEDEPIMSEWSVVTCPECLLHKPKPVVHMVAPDGWAYCGMNDPCDLTSVRELVTCPKCLARKSKEEPIIRHYTERPTSIPCGLSDMMDDSETHLAYEVTCPACARWLIDRLSTVAGPSVSVERLREFIAERRRRAEAEGRASSDYNCGIAAAERSIFAGLEALLNADDPAR